jgi:hypothetical protein
VNAEVTFTPDGGDPSTQNKKVTLKKRRSAVADAQSFGAV